MKKSLILAGLLMISGSALAEEVEKVGFLTTKWCADRGLFADCRMETVFCNAGNCHKNEKNFTTDVNGKLVLFIHDEAKAYKLEFNDGFAMGEMLEKAMNKNEVTIAGNLNGDTITVKSFEAPPPPKKSFFKGCL